MDYSRTARNLIGQIQRFSGELSAGLCKTAGRFITEMLYGIQASQSVVLTKIARRLDEDISLKKTHDRLSSQLQREELGDALNENLLRLASKKIGKDTLLILDPSDIHKQYARKMEYLATVRDGSSGELAKGYWFCQVVATEIGGTEMVPLASRLYSSEAPDFVSENREILDIMDSVGNRGLWVMDRGGDRRKLMLPMLYEGYRFLIRLVGSRTLVAGKTRLPASEIAQKCRPLYSETIVRADGDKTKTYRLEFGYRRVRLPESDVPLWMLVVRGFGKEPMMLLTTEPLRKSRKVLWKYVRAYMKRWAIEENIRFIKQSYDLEDVRVLGYVSLRNLMVLVLCVSYFTCVVLDPRSRLKVMSGYVLAAAKRVFGIPDFHFYAIADGVNNILSRLPGSPLKSLPRNKSPDPLSLGLPWQ